MNKKKYLLMFVAIVATSAGFTACNSEDDLANAEQNGVVKTEFTIAIPRQMAVTRQADNVVQLSSNLFRGISGIELLPFKTVKTGVSTDSEIPSSITLKAGVTVGKSGASGLSANTIASTGALYTGSNSHLYKDIPTQAGMGGGSSDCGFMITLLNEQFHLGLSNEQMIRYAARLGADCAFFILNKPCYAEGVGIWLLCVRIFLFLQKRPSH